MDELKACPLPKECQYCEHFEMKNCDAICEKGHTILMYCSGKDFELDSFIAQALSDIQPENLPLTLDQLKQMGGEPVYMVYARKGFNSWILSDDAPDYIDEVQNCGATAYAHKPQQEEK